MCKETRLVGLANRASNVAQNVRLGGIQDRLSGPPDIAAAQAQEDRWTRLRFHRAEQKAKHIAKYKEVVWQGERIFPPLHVTGKPVDTCGQFVYGRSRHFGKVTSLMRSIKGALCGC